MEYCSSIFTDTEMKELEKLIALLEEDIKELFLGWADEAQKIHLSSKDEKL